ncbi:aminotransferase class I/II-fold pyridoxal phosphate-dependent enzyme [Mycobacterium sp. DSM 3803]|uniref:pyridoxal phosphate-dependent aminotransferase n=1 Tax=Mycolicibacterium sp. TaxID=2320850 RepID=UPI00093C6709|nr:aminotransferase class I/II-fold pyridoxal phosphate-dependent enzyme [Mycobacterium sp. DSM 3803]OKH68604.1 aminotransferase [Mycobacterium sp. SWH-M3]
MTVVAESRPQRFVKSPLQPPVAMLPTAVDPMALSLNENPFRPLPAVRAALIESIDAANRYPEFMPETLRHLIADHIGLPDEQVILGPGATGVMLQVLHAITDPGNRIVIADPTFEGYPIVSDMVRISPIKVPLDPLGHHDLRAMADAAVDARVVAICRPHNPTGTVESPAAIEEFLNRVPSDTVVLIDEAYVEFVCPGHRMDAVSLVRRFPNLVVMRTFSKAYGLAGLRIGYAFGSRDLADKLWAMQLPFGMSTTSLVAVAASYQAESQLRHRIRLITAERRNLQMRLRAMGIESTEAHANFIYLPAAGVCWRQVFDHAGVRVKHYFDGGVRITIGGRSSTGAVLTALRNKL